MTATFNKFFFHSDLNVLNIPLLPSQFACESRLTFFHVQVNMKRLSTSTYNIKLKQHATT